MPVMAGGILLELAPDLVDPTTTVPVTSPVTWVLLWLIWREIRNGRS